MLGTAARGAACGGACFPCRWQILVDLGAGAGAWVEPAHRAAGTGRAWHRRQGAIVRARACASLDDPARPGIHDDVVTPSSAPQWLDRVPHPFKHRGSDMKRSAAEILEEYGPFAGAERVNGVTYDGQNVWFAAGNKLVAFEPTNGKMKRTIDVAAHAGTAFDGRHLFQIAEDRIQKIDPNTGRVLGSIPAPGGGGDSGLAWAEGTLWVGESRARKIHQIDPETGTILRTIDSNRFVTGVTWVEGELWHGTWEGDQSEVRRVDPQSGEVLEQLEMPSGIGVSGLESDGGERFFCGGGSSGTVRSRAPAEAALIQATRGSARRSHRCVRRRNRSPEIRSRGPERPNRDRCHRAGPPRRPAPRKGAGRSRRTPLAALA